jgi:DNA-binding XRE family transcriptional regulator
MKTKFPKKIQDAIDRGDLILYSDMKRSWSPEKKARVEAAGRRLRLARLLRDLRTNKCFSQSDLAKKMKVKREYISRIESGSQNITLDTLYRIGDAVGKELELNFK